MSARPITWGLALALGAAACQSGSSPGDPGSPARSQPAASASAFSVEVDLNGRNAAPIDADCTRGLFVSTRVKNLSSRPLQVQRLVVTFEPTFGACGMNTPGIDPSVNRSLAPGQAEEVRVFDAAGMLCAAPYGRPGCEWRATSSVFTDAGSATGALAFSTTAGGGRPGETGCERAVPVVFSPRSGETVSGTVDVTTSVGETSSCVMSARSLVAIYSEAHVIVATSTLDYGSIFHWDTTRVASGHYSIRARQNCCGIEGPPVEVTVRN